MKKISILLGAALVAAALFLSGCVTQHPDDKYLPVDNIWLVGNVTGWNADNFKNVLEFETADKQTFTLKQEATDEVMKAVGNDKKLFFKLLVNDKGWDFAWIKSDLTNDSIPLGTPVTLQNKNDFGHAMTLPIEEGKTYTFTVQVKSQKEMTLTVKKE